jgi:hypothetical protein
MRICWKMHYLQPITWFYDFFLRKTKIFQKYIKQTKKFLWPNKKIRGFWWTLVQFCPIPQRITHFERFVGGKTSSTSYRNANFVRCVTWDLFLWFMLSGLSRMFQNWDLMMWLSSLVLKSFDNIPSDLRWLKPVVQ